MSTNQKTAKIVGVLFFIATATYMLGSGLLQSVFDAPDYLRQVSHHKTQVIIGVLLQFIDTAAIVGIGILLFPIVKKHHEPFALGYVGSRILECAFLVLGGICSLLLIPLSQAYLQAGAPNDGYFQTLGALLTAGSSIAYQVAMLALGLGSVLFCYVCYTAQFIPRSIALLGLVGYAALAAGAVLELFGVKLGLILSIPGGVFELILPIWLIIKGFNPAASGPRPVLAEAR